MLDQKDLQAIAELIDARALKTEDKIEELSGRIGVLKETTGELSGRITSLEETTGELSGRITSLEETTGELSGRITSLEETTGELSGRITTLEETTGELSGRITSLEETTGELSGKVISLEDKITCVERMLMSGLVKTEDKLTHRIGRIETELREIKEYYKINRIENGNVDLTLRILEGFQKRLEILEKKLA